MLVKLGLDVYVVSAVFVRKTPFEQLTDERLFALQCAVCRKKKNNSACLQGFSAAAVGGKNDIVPIMPPSWCSFAGRPAVHSRFDFYRFFGKFYQLLLPKSFFYYLKIIFITMVV